MNLFPGEKSVLPEASLTSLGNTLNASRSIPERDRWHDRCPFHRDKKGVETNVPCNLNFDSFAFRQQFERWQNVFRI